MIYDSKKSKDLQCNNNNDPVSTNLRFLHDLDEIHVVLHWVDDYQHVSKVSWDDATPVVPAVLGPHYVHLIISQVTQLPNKQN